MLKKYQEKLNPIFILILLLLFIGGMAAMRHSANRVAFYHESQPILDLRMGYSVQECQDYLTGLGQEGRDEYANHYFYIDLIYMIIYNTFYFSTLLYLFRLSKSKYRLYKIVLLLPLLSLIFDLGENLLIHYMIRNFPNISSAMCQAADIFTILKFLCVYSSLTSVCILLLILFATYIGTGI